MEPQTLIWTNSVDNSGAARHHHSASVVNDSLVVFGGRQIHLTIFSLHFPWPPADLARPAAELFVVGEAESADSQRDDDTPAGGASGR